MRLEGAKLAAAHTGIYTSALLLSYIDRFLLILNVLFDASIIHITRVEISTTRIDINLLVSAGLIVFLIKHNVSLQLCYNSSPDHYKITRSLENEGLL